MRKYLLPVAVLFCISLYYSCTKDHTSVPIVLDCTGVNAATNTYALNIGPNIVDTYCAYAPACHAANPTNGIDMHSYSATVNTFKTQNVICALKDGGCELMPKGGPALPDSLIKQMQCWANNNYPQ